jgi:hypothetical protein
MIADWRLQIADCRLRWMHSVLGGSELLNLQSAFYNLKSLDSIPPAKSRIKEKPFLAPMPRVDVEDGKI